MLTVRRTILALLLMTPGCVYVNTLPEAKTRLPALREHFDKFCERSRPADGTPTEEWETARRAFQGEMRSIQHDLDPGFEIEEAGVESPVHHSSN